MKKDDDKEKQGRRYFSWTLHADIELARENERNRLNEIDIIEKDLEFINKLTLDEIETIWYLRHMPETLAKRNRIQIKKDFDSVSDFLEIYGYIKRPY